MTVNATAERNVENAATKRRRRSPDDSYAQTVAELRAGLSQCITLSMVKQVIDTLFSLALTGNIPAARLFLQYAVGKPEVIATEEPSAAPVPVPSTTPALESLLSEALASLGTSASEDAVTKAVEASPASVPAPSKVQTACTDAAAPDQTVRTASESTVRVAVAAGSNGSPSVPRFVSAPNTPRTTPAPRAGDRGA
jgi:hypothetical protein